MSESTAYGMLQAFARKWNRQILLSSVLKAFGLAIMGGLALGHVMAWTIESQVLIGFMTLLVCAVVLSAISWRKRADAKLMARHLNRKCPELEESCGLVL
ncbi:MAG: hypothetical protein V3U73_14075, partial [bacterium]